MLTRLVVVDDAVEECQRIGVVLDPDEFVIECFDDPLKAVAAMRLNCPDVLVLDVRMSPIDGFDVLRMLRGDSRTQDVVVVLYTQIGNDDDVKIRALGFGVDHVVDKNSARPLALLVAVLSRMRSGRSPRRDSYVFQHVGGRIVISGDGRFVQREAGAVKLDVELGPLQAGVLLRLAQNQGRPVPVDELCHFLFEELMGERASGIVHQRSRLYRFMLELRKVVDPVSGAARCIRNTRNVGYYISGDSGN